MLLDDMSAKLMSRLSDVPFEGKEKLGKFPELVWAILQHYEVCDTPLIDVTSSLRVAASFALNSSPDDGHLFVFGLPHPSGSISYSVELELLNMRLLSICPPTAHRPYFQEGFLVGSFPSRRTTRHISLDLRGRLIAKFKLVGNSFWDNNFHSIPRNALFPNDDPFEAICRTIKSRAGGSG